MDNSKKYKKTGSIQSKLIISLLLSLPVIWILGSLYIKHNLIHEVSEMNDTQMTQLSKYLLAFSDEIDVNESINNNLNNKTLKIFSLSQIIANSKHKNIHFNDEDFMGFAVWDISGRLIMADNSGKDFEFLPKQEGFINNHNNINMWYSFLPQQQNKWRFLYLHNATEDKVIAVGQSYHEMQEIIYSFFITQFLNMIFSLLAISILVIYFVKHSFTPLKKVSAVLAQRKPNDDRPLDINPPKEIKPFISALNNLFVKVSSTLAREQRFTADASHELRSPLTSLKLQADIMEQELLGLKLSEQNEDKLLTHIQQMKSGIERSNHLIEQLLTLAQLESKQNLQTKKLQNIDWLNLSEEVLKILNISARNKYIRLQREVLCANNEILPIQGNPILLSLILRNLLDNAIRYTAKQGVIKLKLNADKIEIIDNGNGVNEENLVRLSERFFRPAGQTETGSGLGLSIVKRIAELHNLQIFMENIIEKNKVSGFRVILQKVKK